MGNSLLDRWRRPSASTRLPVVTLNARLRGIWGLSLHDSLAFGAWLAWARRFPTRLLFGAFWGRLAARRKTTRFCWVLRLVVARLALVGSYGSSLHDLLFFLGLSVGGCRVSCNVTWRPSTFQLGASPVGLAAIHALIPDRGNVRAPAPSPTPTPAPVPPGA